MEHVYHVHVNYIYIYVYIYIRVKVHDGSLWISNPARAIYDTNVNTRYR